MSNIKKQKYYCCAVTEILYKKDSEQYIRELQQYQNSFNTIEEAIESFLLTEGYDKNIDGELQFANTLDGEENSTTTIGFSKILKEDGTRPSKEELTLWSFGQKDLVEHSISMLIYEFTYKIIGLKEIKKNIKKIIK